MIMVSFLLQIVALVFLFLAAINVGMLPQDKPRIVTGWLGMFLWLLSLLLMAKDIVHPYLR